jgi:hypothetical protein
MDKLPDDGTAKYSVVDKKLPIDRNRSQAEPDKKRLRNCIWNFDVYYIRYITYIINGGVDETRTRGLLRDRQAF